MVSLDIFATSFVQPVIIEQDVNFKENAMLEKALLDILSQKLADAAQRVRGMRRNESLSDFDFALAGICRVLSKSRQRGQSYELMFSKPWKLLGITVFWRARCGANGRARRERERELLQYRIQPRGAAW